MIEVDNSYRRSFEADEGSALRVRRWLIALYPDDLEERSKFAELLFADHISLPTPMTSQELRKLYDAPSAELTLGHPEA